MEDVKNKFYRVLDKDNNLIPADMFEFEAFFKSSRRIVARTIINRKKRIFVSTVCLGIDHGWSRPMWFETMVFGTSINGFCRRYETYREAKIGHAKAVFYARQARKTWKTHEN